MRRIVVILIIILSACRPAPTPSTSTAPSFPSAATPSAPMPTPTLGRPPGPASIGTPATPSASPPDSSTAEAYQVRFHPGDRLYVGDQVSFEVIAPPDSSTSALSVNAEFPTLDGQQTAGARFTPYGIGRRVQANLQWAWDTTGLQAGEKAITFSVEGGPTWVEKISLLPMGQLPPAEARSEWKTATSECCRVSYISGTLAERNLPELLDEIDRQAEAASERLEVTPDEPIGIFLAPRVIGHGGFAGSSITVSYLERDYIGGEKERILHHEIIHILDSKLGGALRPSMLVEGLAVYLSGGHFEAEALLPRAAALLPPQDGCIRWGKATSADNTAEGCGLDRFVPLRALADDFYHQQHEIGYLEAGAFIEYMVNIWGWDRYEAFYRDIRPIKSEAGSDQPDNSLPSAALDAALQTHFGLSLDELEIRFRQVLDDQVVTPQTVEDLRLSLLHYDTARRYQLYLDPSAHFLTAWLPDAEEMRKRGIVAEFLRRPSAEENLTLETMLVSTADYITGPSTAVDLEETNRLLRAVNRVLDAYPHIDQLTFAADPGTQDYYSLVRLALEMGYEPQQIYLENETARMLVSTSEAEIIELSLHRAPQGWRVVKVSGTLPG